MFEGHRRNEEGKDKKKMSPLGAGLAGVALGALAMDAAIRIDNAQNETVPPITLENPLAQETDTASTLSKRKPEMFNPAYEQILIELKTDLNGAVAEVTPAQKEEIQKKVEAAIASYVSKFYNTSPENNKPNRQALVDELSMTMISDEMREGLDPIAVGTSLNVLKNMRNQ